MLWKITAYVVRSLAGSFLTPAVVMTFGAALFAYLALGQPGSADLAAILGPLVPEGASDIDIRTDELMLAYSVLSAIVGLIAGALSTLGRRLLGRRVVQGPLGWGGRILAFLKSGFFFISVVFAAALLLIPSIRIAEGSPLILYALFSITYVVSIVCYGIYHGINYAADYIPGQRRAPAGERPA